MEAKERRSYETPELEVVYLEFQDIIVTSGCGNPIRNGDYDQFDGCDQNG